MTLTGTGRKEGTNQPPIERKIEKEGGTDRRASTNENEGWETDIHPTTTYYLSLSRTMTCLTVPWWEGRNIGGGTVP
jgi:hypothetical protein